MKVYLIPGLAADKRVFRHILLPEGYEPCYLEWLPPAKGESLQEYALRMAEQIDRQEEFILAGLSFGGMLAVEIAKKYPAQKLILIASISHPSQLPAYYRRVYKMGLHRIITPSILKYGVHFKRYFTSERADDKKIIREMARDMDHEFIRWALRAIVYWETDDHIPEAHHIHGTADNILPHRYTKPTITLEKAGHLMIFDRAGEINRVLASLL
jgi:pimeloyl-ACP methyl ester carboxylesterase